MDFFDDAVKTLQIIVRAVHGYEDRTAWRGRRHRKPLIYQGQAVFNRKHFLSNRLKVRPCNKQVKPVITE